MNSIKLTVEYIHPSEDISSHKFLKEFEATITYVKQFEIGTYSLFGEFEDQKVLIGISNNDGMTEYLPKKQYYLNSCKNLEQLSSTQCAAFISLFKRKIAPLKNLINHTPNEEPLLSELTRDSFGWLMWGWQVMGLISFYIPTVEPNIFINQLHNENQAAWTLLKEIQVISGSSLYELLKSNSLGLRYDTPQYYFGNELKQLIERI